MYALKDVICTASDHSFHCNLLIVVLRLLANAQKNDPRYTKTKRHEIEGFYEVREKVALKTRAN